MKELETIYTSQFWKKRHYIFVDFLCRCEMDRVTLDNREIQGYSWVWPGEGLRLNLESFTRNVVEGYLAPRLEIQGRKGGRSHSEHVTNR